MSLVFVDVFALLFSFKKSSRKKITHVSFFFMLPSGESQKHEFQAETRQLLDIVARTLYSEKEVLVLTDYDE